MSSVSAGYGSSETLEEHMTEPDAMLWAVVPQRNGDVRAQVTGLSGTAARKAGTSSWAGAALVTTLEFVGCDVKPPAPKPHRGADRLIQVARECRTREEFDQYLRQELRYEPGSVKYETAMLAWAVFKRDGGVPRMLQPSVGYPMIGILKAVGLHLDCQSASRRA
jgi:hypothetical protein